MTDQETKLKAAANAHEAKRCVCDKHHWDSVYLCTIHDTPAASFEQGAHWGMRHERERLTHELERLIHTDERGDRVILWDSAIDIILGGE